MNDLDLSFAKKVKPEQLGPAPKIDDGELDLSFAVDKNSMVRTDPKTRQTTPNLTFGQKLADFFTGSQRQTRAREELPELQTSGLLSGEDGAKTAAISQAILTMTDPDEIAQALSSNFENVVVTYDKDPQGNIYPILNNRENGAQTVINKPGVSGLDVIQGLGLGAAFFPSAKAGAGTTAALSKMASVGAKSAATQTAIETGQAAAGGDFNPSDIGLAGLFGGAFEGLSQVVGRGSRAIFEKMRSGRIDDGVRQTFKSEAERLGLDPDSVSDDVIRSWAQQADNRLGAEREFNTTLTRGQRSGDQAQLSLEDSYRSGARGAKPQDIYLREETKQLDDLTSASKSIQRDIGAESPVLESRQEAGAAIREGVKAAEKTSDEAIAQAYSGVGDASISPEGFAGLLKATRQATDSIEYPKVGNVQAWEGLQKQIQAAEKTFSNLMKTPGAKVKPIHINQLDSIRKAIGNAAEAAGSPADRRNVLAMKSAFDDAMDKAVINQMFSGDPGSLEALKGARQVFKDYMVKFGQNIKSSRLGRGSDAEGAFIKKIILEDPTDEQVINSLWSASGFNKQSAANLAKRYKEILKPNSDEWGMVRQAAFDDLMVTKKVGDRDVIDGARTLTKIRKAEKSNKSLIDELFTSDEWNKIKRFAALAKRTSPDLVKSRENPSGTAQKMAKLIGNFLPLIDVSTAIGAQGGVVIRNARNASGARQSFRPFSHLNKTFVEDAAEAASIGQTENISSGIQGLLD